MVPLAVSLMVPVMVPVKGAASIMFTVHGFVLRVVRGLVASFADGFVSRRAVVLRQERN
jgi:hypothetical protein